MQFVDCLLLHTACAEYTNSHIWQVQMARIPHVLSALWLSWMKQYLTSTPDTEHCLLLRTLRKSSTRKQSARAAVSIDSVSAREVSGAAWLTRSANKSLDSCETWRTCRGSIQRERTDEEEKADGVGLELEARRRSDQMIKAQI